MDIKSHAFFILVSKMSVILSDIIDVMERIAPVCLTEKWDNSGLQIGNKDWPIKTIWVSLDATPFIVEAACNKGVNLLITHHPLIFNPIHSVDLNTPLGHVINMAIHNQLAIFSAHTNLDKVTGGVNDILATQIGLTNIKPLEKIEIQDSPTNDHKGFGRVGRFSKGMTLERLADKIKKTLTLNSIKIAGRTDLFIESAAVCSGSGSSLLGNFLSSDAQVYISGDLKYHDARMVEEVDRGIIDIGHFGSEYVIVNVLVEHLRQELTGSGHDIIIDMCGSEKDPFVSL